MSKFGILSKFQFLQNISSNLIAHVNPAVVHNIGKYFAIKKAFYLSSLEEIDGDYYEFGVYTGSSFSHALRCAKSSIHLNKSFSKMHFYGYDSFEGFGKLDEKDIHFFYTDINFETDYQKVSKRIKKLIPVDQFSLIKGFFDQTLHEKASSDVRIAFFDSDTYQSSDLTFRFLGDRVKNGTIFILDDYFSYSGSKEKGVKRAFNEFIFRNKVDYRYIGFYGMGGVLLIINTIK